jgi:voltage-gated sodium channel
MPGLSLSPYILVATFTILNRFIAIIVNAMQGYSGAEHQETVQALQETQDHIEADLHGELRAMRAEIGELKRMLADRVTGEVADRSSGVVG